jgi:hypothetical protein
MNWGRTLKKAILSNDLATEFLNGVGLRRDQLRAVCGSEGPSATKETPASSRQDIWAELWLAAARVDVLARAVSH